MPEFRNMTYPSSPPCIDSSHNDILYVRYRSFPQVSNHSDSSCVPQNMQIFTCSMLFTIFWQNQFTAVVLMICSVPLQKQTFGSLLGAFLFVLTLRQAMILEKKLLLSVYLERVIKTFPNNLESLIQQGQSLFTTKSL